MSEEARGPVAIRITRPYANEADFLEHELDCVGKSGVVLVGAQQRPEGSVLRFELVLKSGEMLLRGEGRVVGFKQRAVGDSAGLALRFTRLDAKSKAFIDRAALARDAKGKVTTGERPSLPSLPPSMQAMQTVQAVTVVPSALTAVPPRPGTGAPGRPSSGPPPLPKMPTRPPPLPPAVAFVDPETTYVDSAEPDKAEAEDARATVAPGVTPARGAASTARAAAPSVRPEAPRETAQMAVAPAKREELLDRLRKRAQSLDAARMSALVPSRNKA